MTATTPPLEDGGLSLKVAGVEYYGAHVIKGLRCGSAYAKGDSLCEFALPAGPSTTDPTADPFDAATTYPELVKGATVVMAHTLSAASVATYGLDPTLIGVTTNLFTGIIAADPLQTVRSGGSDWLPVSCIGTHDALDLRKDKGVVFVANKMDAWKPLHITDDQSGRFVNKLEGDVLHLRATDDRTYLTGSRCARYLWLLDGLVPIADGAKLTGFDFEYKCDLNANWRVSGWVGTTPLEAYGGVDAFHNVFAFTDTSVGAWTAASYDIHAKGTAPAESNCLLVGLEHIAGSGSPATDQWFKMRLGKAFGFRDPGTGAAIRVWDLGAAAAAIGDAAGLDVTGVGTVGGTLDGLELPPFQSVAAMLDGLAERSPGLLDYRINDDALTFAERETVAATIRALPTSYTVDLDHDMEPWDFHKGVAEAPDGVVVQYRCISDPDGVPDGTVRAVTVGAGLTATSLVDPLDLTEMAPMTAAVATAQGQAYLDWYKNWQGSGGSKRPTLLCSDGGTVAFAPYAKAGDFIEGAQQVAADSQEPIYITAATYELDSGALTLESVQTDKSFVAQIAKRQAALHGRVKTRPGRPGAHSTTQGGNVRGLPWDVD